jgi:RHS repeat-associated protein
MNKSYLGLNSICLFQNHRIHLSKFYSFGSLLTGRVWSPTSTDKYRFGFNGKENDDESRAQDYGMRIYNPELGRFLSIDPVTKDFASFSPYCFAANSPLLYIDFEGAFKVEVTEEAKKKWGLTEQEVAQFTQIINNIEILIKSPDGQELIKHLAAETGLTPEQIKSYSENGKGPTIRIVARTGDGGAFYTPTEGNLIEVDGSVLQILSKAQARYSAFNDEEEERNYAGTIFLMVKSILHEFTHFGDIETNGLVTDKGGGTQDKEKADNGYERGVDTEVFLCGEETAWGNYDSPEEKHTPTKGAAESTLKGAIKKGWSAKNIIKTFIQGTHEKLNKL